MEETYPDKESEYAAEGTLAHELAETQLKNFFGTISKANYNASIKKIKSSKFYNKEMQGHIDGFVQYVIDRYNSYIDPMIFIEQQVDLRAYIKDGFGHIDITIIGGEVLEIIDLKYGKGKTVYAESNPQLMIYALGAYDRYKLLYDVQTVKLNIYQPRKDNYGYYEISVTDLVTWAEDILKPQASLAYEGQGEFKPGDHCDFCKARNECRALAELNLKLAGFNAQDPDKLNDFEIAEILEKADLFIKWIDSIKQHALNEALTNGKKWPGMKLVAGRANRVYADKESIIKTLKSHKFKTSVFMTKPELVGITALQSAIGKETVDKILSPYIIKPEGKPVLVPVWDKRPELNGHEKAVEVFAEVDVEK